MNLGIALKDTMDRGLSVSPLATAASSPCQPALRPPTKAAGGGAWLQSSGAHGTPGPSPGVPGHEDRGKKLETAGKRSLNRWGVHMGFTQLAFDSRIASAFVPACFRST